MAEPFLGEVRIVGFNFAPKGWAFCNGQLLPINQNQALFALLGTTYGGDGRVNFALPNLQGRMPIHFNGNHPFGSQGGEPSHTLSMGEMASHTHTLNAVSTTGNSNNPVGNLLASSPAGLGNTYGPAPDAQHTATMSPAAVGSQGGSQAHENLQPFLVLNFIIALQGIFPSQN